MNDRDVDDAGAGHKVVIFGLLDLADLAHFYLTTDSPHDVVGFSVSGEYMPDEPTFRGLPVVPFETVEETFSPEDHRFLVPMTHRRVNSVRADMYGAVTEKGYRCVSYVSSHATVFHPDAIGENCFILEDVTVQPFVRIGDNVVIWSGSHIGHHSVIEDHAFVTSQVVVSGHCTIRERAVLGVNSAMRDGATIGEGAFVGMGAGVVGDADPWGVYTGLPAKKWSRSSTELDE